MFQFLSPQLSFIAAPPLTAPSHPFHCFPAINLIPFTEAVFCIKGTLCSSSRWLHPSPQIFLLQWFTLLSKQFTAHLPVQSQLILICFVAAQLTRRFILFSFTFKASCTPLESCWWSMKVFLAQARVERRFSHLEVSFCLIYRLELLLGRGRVWSVKDFVWNIWYWTECAQFPMNKGDPTGKFATSWKQD